MANSTVASLRKPAPTGVAPDIPVAFDNLTADLDPIVVPKFNTVTDRNLAYASLSDAQKEGSVCYIRDRDGHSYWDDTSNDWEWQGVNRVIFRGSRAGDAETAGGGGLGVSIILMPNITLPPGNRMIDIFASTLCTNINDTALEKHPRLYVTGGIRDERFLGAGTTQTSLRITDTVVMSGIVNYDLRGLNNGTGALRFSASVLTIIDRGPVDA